jgi:hypothetical protein
MRIRWPKTYQYLRHFEKVLLARGSNTVRELAERTEPWAMFGIGEYTFAPYRVAWKRMASDLVAAVLGDWHTPFGLKRLLPTDTTAFIPVEQANEAHFLAGMLNSSPVRAYVKSFSSAGRGFGAPSILKYIAIPRFDAADPNHAVLSALAEDASRIAASGGLDTLAQVEEQIDRTVAAILGLDPDAPKPVEGRTGPFGL